MKASGYTQPCDEIIVLKEKVAALEAWRANTGLDLEALARLVEDYEKAEMPCAAESLRRRLEWYRSDDGGKTF